MSLNNKLLLSMILLTHSIGSHAMEVCLDNPAIEFTQPAAGYPVLTASSHGQSSVRIKPFLSILFEKESVHPLLSLTLQKSALYKQISKDPALVFGRLSIDLSLIKKLVAEGASHTGSLEKAKRLLGRVKSFEVVIGLTGKLYNFSELIEHVDGILKSREFSFRQKIDTAMVFRHLTSPDHILGKNQLGDYVAEMILIDHVIAQLEEVDPLSVEEKNLLAEAFYELSQTYSHLIDYSGKIFWGQGEDACNGNLMVSLKSGPKILEVGVNYVDLIERKLNLLMYAVKNNENHPSAFGRICEFLFNDLTDTEMRSFLSLAQDESRIANWLSLKSQDLSEILNLKELSLEDLSSLRTKWEAYNASTEAVRVDAKNENTAKQLLGSVIKTMKEKLDELSEKSSSNLTKRKGGVLKDKRPAKKR